MVVGAVIVVAQVPMPVHAVPPEPTDQPTNSEPSSVDAVSESWEPCGTFAVQAPGQLIPTDGEVTIPSPEPPRTIVTRCSAMSKVAVIVVAVSTGTVQVVVEPPQPLQRANAAPGPGVAVRVTAVPSGNAALQEAPQSMPPGLEETVPVDVPLRTMVRIAVREGPCASALGSVTGAQAGPNNGTNAAMMARRMMRREDGCMASSSQVSERLHRCAVACLIRGHPT